MEGGEGVGRRGDLEGWEKGEEVEEGGMAVRRFRRMLTRVGLERTA